MTAAHCVTDDNNAVIRGVIAFLGVHNVRDLGSADQIQTVLGPRNILVHSAYDYARLGDGHDLALLRLPSEARLNSKVRLICLPKGPAPRSTAEMVVAGWGKTSLEAPPSEVLKTATMFTHEFGECNAYWENYLGSPLAGNDLVLCARNGTGNVYFGDSGGFGGQKNGDQYEQWGVVSFGDLTLSPSSFTVFTDVRSHMIWLYQTMYPDNMKK